MMIGDAFGVILTGGSNMQLKDLTFSRSVAAVPFGGRYRCIDFVLSSMVNSGISNVGIVAEKNYHSLMDHLGSGKEWDLHRKRDGLFILPPFVTRENTGLYRGSVDALRSISGYIHRCAQKYAVLSGSYTIFNMQFNDVLKQHIETGADITLVYNEGEPGPEQEPFKDVRVVFDESGRMIDMAFDPARPNSPLRSLNVMIMEKSLLEYLVEEAIAHGRYQLHRDVLMRNMDQLKIYGYRYDGYVARLSSLNAYFRHNMELLDPKVRADLFNPEHPIYTKVKDEVSARYGPRAKVSNSIVADGCVIDGEIEDCVLFRGVSVGAGSRLRNCIVLQGAEIQENCRLENVILDKSVIVKRGRSLVGDRSFPIILRKGTIV